MGGYGTSSMIWQVSECLERRLSTRPSEEELQNRNILRWRQAWGRSNSSFILCRRTSEEEMRAAKEETRRLLQRRLSFRWPSLSLWIVIYFESGHVWLSWGSEGFFSFLTTLRCWQTKFEFEVLLKLVLNELIRSPRCSTMTMQQTSLGLDWPRGTK